MEVKSLKFDEQGLIPAIIQDSRTYEVLTLAYMNVESLARTIQTGQTWFWSRSRGELWHKGATSGNFQKVVDIRIDCDGDALVVLVEPEGPACHLGERTCFHNGLQSAEPRVWGGERSLDVVKGNALELGILLDELYRIISERRASRPEGSYTTYLFNAGIDKILKKVGEESAETIIAAKNSSKSQVVAETSDLLYHLLVMLCEMEVRLEEVYYELKKRAGLPADPKYSQ